jgi:hypothetical protein
VWSGAGAHVVRLQWRPIGAGADIERFQAMRIQDAKIIEIAGYPTLGNAVRIAKRFASRGA